MYILYSALCVIIFLAFRPKALYHPANFIFVFYALYLLLPASIFFVYEAFNISYVLPWGKINDWDNLSHQSLFDFFLVFLMFFIILRLVISNKKMASLNVIGLKQVRLSKKRLYFVMFCSTVLIMFYFQATGGSKAWLANGVSNYIAARAGLGLQNLILLHLTNLFAFILGLIWYFHAPRRYRTIILCILAILIFSALLQGLKSRLAYYLFFSLAPFLMHRQVGLVKSAYLFLFFLSLFSFGMYFRSNGLYAGRAATEYFLSYFNIVFLHDMSLVDSHAGSFFALGMGFQKYLEVFGQEVSRLDYDLSVRLTSQYFPTHWFERSATMQWPIATELYLSFPYRIFWVIPIFLHCIWLRSLITLSNKDCFFVFIFLAEVIRLMTLMRSSFLPWNLAVTLLFYAFLFLVWRFLRVRVASSNDQ